MVCGPLERDPESRVTATSPTVIVEVASDGTEEWDRNEKLQHYQQIPSLRECVVVSHRKPLLELWRREPDGTWSHQSASRAETLALKSIGCVLDVDEVYRRGQVA